MKFCIFGLQRSGTTFLEFLIKQNFKCEVANGANWKHSLTKVNADGLVFNIYKNPYTWIESIVFRDPADLLVNSPHLLDEGYNIGHDQVNLENLSKLYNDYVLSWYDIKTFVRYEDIINPVERNKFLTSLPFERITNEWVVPKPGSLFMSEGFSDTSLEYYFSEKPSRLQKNELSIINDNITVDVFNILGYTRLTPV